MYIKRLYLKNLGPIAELTIEPRFDKEGRPVPVVLVGQNGAGKSLTLAVALDAITEARRRSFDGIPEVAQTDYLRLSSKNYVYRSSKLSHTQVLVTDSTNELRYDEVVARIPFSEIQTSAPEILKLPGINNGHFKSSGFHKHISIPDQAKSAVTKLSFLYFPFFRYERANWMSDAAKIDFAKVSDYYGKAKLNPIRTNIIEETQRWILNVLLDRELYEKQTVPISLPDGTVIPAWIGYKGSNTQLFTMVNEIMTAMLQAKDPNIESARIGIGPKGNRIISVFATKKGSSEEVVVPDLSQLSSGELMTLGLATEIIRSYELVENLAPASLIEVTGLVLVDEIDLHLHVSFQKTVLPTLLRKFPKVQFILTTHSPFFLLGMAESGEIDIYSLPLGNRISPEEFEEFQASYDVFIQKNEQYRSRYQLLSEQVAKEKKPLLITEGKTDWQHLKMALLHFQELGEYKDLDISFFEFDDEVEMGDEKLSQMCMHMATINHNRQIIFIFDRDNPKIVKRIMQESKDYRDLGNHVYAFCIPIPLHRSTYRNISIEFYYTDNDLRTIDPVSGKRLWFSNEIEIITEPTNGEKEYRALTVPNAKTEFDKKVFDQPADKILDPGGRSVGLSKAAFTQVIVGNAQISSNFDRSAFRAIFDIMRSMITLL